MKTFNEFMTEANRWEKEQEKKLRQREKESPKYKADKDIAMMKASRRGSDFISGATHTDFEKRGPHAWAHSDSMKTQRKQAHKSERNMPKKRPGTSPEERVWKKFSGEHNSGRMERVSKSEVRNRKEGLIKQGERRRKLRSQAVRALGNTLGWAHVDKDTIK